MQILGFLRVEDTPLNLNEDRDSDGQQILQAGPILFTKVLKGIELFTVTVCKCSGLIFRYPRERKGQTIHYTISLILIIPSQTLVGLKDKTWAEKHVGASGCQQFNDLGQKKIFSSSFKIRFVAKH